MSGWATGQLAREVMMARMGAAARRPWVLSGILGALGALVVAGWSPALAAGPGRGPGASPVQDVSRACVGQNSEVETATAAPAYVYDLWIGCSGIGFARSADGGRQFDRAIQVRGSGVGPTWDPSIAVAPDGTVYAAYMRQDHGYMRPVVAASFDHGQRFTQVVAVRPPVTGNWGDRDFIAVSPRGTLYLTWDYGPSAAKVKLDCSSGGSCAFKDGDVNSVIQRSSSGGRSWGPITPVGPRFPRNGGYSAPLVVQHDGRVDVLSWGHRVGPGPLDKLYPGHEVFTSSATGRTWPRHPRELWPGNGAIALPTWWIDGDLAIDAGGTLYATWDTQGTRGDIGWLTWSADGGRNWSRPVQVTPGRNHAVHIVEAAGGGPGIAYVGWQTDAPKPGYATYLRPYSIHRGWLGPAIKISPRAGNRRIWPGDTFGIALLPGGKRLALAWGSAIGRHRTSAIYGTVVTVRG
jgi:hypothetical protein